MMKLTGKHSWLFILLVESLIGVAAGIILLASLKVDTVSAGVKIGEQSVAGISFGEAKTKIDAAYDEIIKKGALTLEINQKSYQIPYSEIDAAIDLDKTVDDLKKSTPQNGLELYFMDSGRSFNVRPVFSYNPGKLMTQCEKLFGSFEKAPVSERYEMKQGVLVYIPSVPGIKADYGKIEQLLKDKMLFTGSQTALSADTQSSSLFVETKAESHYKELFTEIVSKAQLSVEPDSKSIDSRLAPLNGLVFEKGQEIDLKSILDFSTFSSDPEKDLLNRISSALYQSAVSIEGVDIVSRTPSKRATAYTQPGLEAVIEGGNANLVLKNETDRPLMLMTETDADSMTFYMISTGPLKSGVLIVQKTDPVPPSTITVVNKDLGPNVTKIGSEGVPGYTVTVSRLIDNDRKELTHDQYEPVSRVIETGDTPILAGDK